MIPHPNRLFACILLLFSLLTPCSGPVAARGAPDAIKPHAGMLRYPHVSAKEIAFLYAGTLWVVPREGGVATPVASPPGGLSHPHFSPDGRTLAFTANYDGLANLYTIPVEGGLPQRITHDSAGDTLWNWTPDGKLLFSNNGQVGLPRQQQLFTVSANGGMPVRLPVPYGEEGAISPDGRWLAYTPSSILNRTWKRYRGGWASDIWLFDLQEKKSKRMTDWEGTDALPMWQGAKVYYLSDNGPEHRLNIWRYDTKTGQRQQVTRLSDYDVKWPAIGPGPHGEGEIVFQHGAELDLLELPSGKIHAVDVRVPGDKPALRPRMVDAAKLIAGARISPTGKHAVIEARGDIWTASTAEGTTPRNLTHTAGVAERDPAWSPDGRWIAYFSDAGGEYELVITQSDGKGETRQLTRGGSAFRLNPQWSPDSKWISFADKSGAITLCSVADGKTKSLDTDPQAQVRPISWSPDSRWIAYAKNTSPMISTIWIYSVETGQKRQVTGGMFSDNAPVFDHKGDYLYFASSRSFHPTYDDQGQTWVYAGTEVILAAPLRADVGSPYLPKVDEEKWADDAKSKSPPKTRLDTGSVAMAAAGVSGEQGAAAAEGDDVSGGWSGTIGPYAVKFTLMLGAGNAVTGTLSSAQGAGTITGTYDPAKKELTLTITLDAGISAGFSGTISGTTLTGTATVMGQALPAKLERTDGPPAKGSGVAMPGAGDAGKPAEAAKPVRVTIDFDGFEGRIMELAVKPGRFGQLAVNDRNQLLYARLPAPGTDGGPSIQLFDINDEKREEKTVAAGAANFDITPDGKKLLVVRVNSGAIQDATAGASGESVVTGGMMVSVDPRAEWRQIFVDAWRMERDYFYDPNMHGVNWKAVRDQYAKMLDDCNSRADVGYVISEMISELNVGHAYYRGMDSDPGPSTTVGKLGADFKLENGAYRIARIVGGAPWDVDARGPLSQPGVKVKEGDYLLAVNGTPLDTAQDPWAAFQGLANSVVTLTFSAKPTLDADARDIPIRLLGSERDLRYRAWIEHNRALVAQKTGGRVGYIYVPDTGEDGQNDLVRQFMGQLDRQALIIDERWNGGGQIPDRFIELLNRPVTNYWARRDGGDWTWPPISQQGPKCMLINGESGSGGDAFPWYFRQARLGKLIGMRTWGGLVGLNGNPGLIDGAGVTVPNFGFYKPNGTWAVEGHGVDPDIEVIDDPALMVNGGDPQLDRAIQQMLDELKQRPYTPPKKPVYPDRSGMGVDPRDR